MSGYLFRLASQSSLKMPNLPAPSAPTESQAPTQPSVADVNEVTEQVETSPAIPRAPLLTHGEPQMPAKPDAPVNDLDKPAEDRRVDLSNAPVDHNKEARPTEPSDPSFQKPGRSIAAVPLSTGLPDFTGPAPEAVKEVFAWIADDQNPAAPTVEHDRSTPASMPVVAHAAPTSVEKSGSAVAAVAADADTTGWSVEIGAIHLTIEAPPPERVEPSPSCSKQVATPPPQPGRPVSSPTGSRLRRHYLRPC